LISRLDKTVAEKGGLGDYEKELDAGTAPSQSTDGTRSGQGQMTIAMVNPARTKPAIPFAKAKGHIFLPAKGQRLTSFGDKTRIGISKGMTLKTRMGAQITSPNDGWVIFAEPFLGYGQLLIINAGGGYHVLLANMAEIDVVVGQFVLSGEPRGKDGLKEAGGSFWHGMIIEDRTDQSEDQHPWQSLKNRKLGL